MSSRMLQAIAVFSLAVAAVAAQSASTRPQGVSSATMFEAARKLETVDGDLKGAIRQYEAIVKAYSADRATVARALLRMGECYQKLGDQQASRLFERIVREFPEQKDVASAAAARLDRRPPHAVAGGVLNRQVWAGPEVDSMGTISSDGRHLSFVDWDTGDLAVRDMATGAKRLLTNKGPWDKSEDFAESSAFSRDGTQLAYAWFNAKAHRYDLRVIRADAHGVSQHRALLDNADVAWIAPYDWTPDGSRVAVQLQRRDRTAQIGLVGTTDGSFVPLLSTEWRGSTRLFLSPDGSLLAFDLLSESDAGTRDVFVMHVNGGARFSVAAHSADETVVGWAPDGKYLLFVSDRSGSRDLWSARIINGQPGPAVTLLRSNMGAVGESLGLDRAGGLVYGVRTSAATIALATLDLERGAVASGPNTPFENYLDSVRAPDWSKNGTLVAVAEQSRTRVSLTFRTPEGKRLRDLPLPMGYAQRPRWAPDGSILVQGVDLKGRQGIYRFDLDTTQVTPVVLGGPDTERVYLHSWVGEGQLMYQRNAGSNRALILRSMPTGVERVLVDNPRLVNHTPSPDGSKIAYAVEDQQAGTTIVNALDLATGASSEILRVAKPAQFGNLLLWTPDGRSILFAKHQNDKRSLWVIPAIGGESKAINLELSLGYASMRMHPDGRRVAYHSGRNAMELWRLDNFLPLAPARSTVGKSR